MFTNIMRTNFPHDIYTVSLKLVQPYSKSCRDNLPGHEGSPLTRRPKQTITKTVATSTRFRKAVNDCRTVEQDCANACHFRRTLVGAHHDTNATQVAQDVPQPIAQLVPGVCTCMPMCKSHLMPMYAHAQVTLATRSRLTHRKGSWSGLSIVATCQVSPLSADTSTLMILRPPPE